MHGLEYKPGSACCPKSQGSSSFSDLVSADSVKFDQALLNAGDNLSVDFKMRIENLWQLVLKDLLI